MESIIKDMKGHPSYYGIDGETLTVRFNPQDEENAEEWFNQALKFYRDYLTMKCTACYMVEEKTLTPQMLQGCGHLKGEDECNCKCHQNL